MSAKFVRGVLAFGFLAATGFVAYAHKSLGLSWAEGLRAWLLLFGVLALAPLGVSLFSPVSWAYRIGLLEGRRARRDRGE